MTRFHTIAEDEDERRASLPGYHADTFAAGAVWGAGWAFAILGMAEAIAEREACCKRCWEWLGDCECRDTDSAPTNTTPTGSDTKP